MLDLRVAPDGVSNLIAETTVPEVRLSVAIVKLMVVPALLITMLVLLSFVLPSGDKK